MEKVVITGMGVATPLGWDLKSFWSGLVEGKSGVQLLEGEDFQGLPSRIGALVNPQAVLDFIGKKGARRISLASQLALLAAEEAIGMARLDAVGETARREVAIVIGSSIGGFQASDPIFRDYYVDGRQSAFAIPMSMNSGPAANVSIRYGFGGPQMTADAACASSAHSVGYVFNMIRFGLIDMAVTGGADSPFARGVMQAWCNLRVLSERNDDPPTACRPFSADRDGLVLGEGAGIMVVESERSAIRRGVPILAEIKGYGASSDGHHITQPSQDGPVRAMQKALADAGIGPGRIDHINAHATGTQWNDKNETAAIKQVFAEQAYKIPVIGTKAALGHSIGASGALELISSVLSLQNQSIPPTINHHIPDPDCDLDYVTEGYRDVALTHILSNSFAFGGSNGALVVGRYTDGA